MIVSSNSSFPIDKVAAAANGPLWFQLYAAETEESTRERVDVIPLNAAAGTPRRR